MSKSCTNRCSQQAHLYMYCMAWDQSISPMNQCGCVTVEVCYDTGWTVIDSRSNVITLDKCIVILVMFEILPQKWYLVLSVWSMLFIIELACTPCSAGLRKNTEQALNNMTGKLGSYDDACSAEHNCALFMTLSQILMEWGDVFCPPW